MSCVQGFIFSWGDAFMSIGYGSRCVLTSGADGTFIDYIVDKECGQINVTGREQEFADDILSCGLESWKNKKYSDDLSMDGTSWHISADVTGAGIIEATGFSDYPPEWNSFLTCLHTKWGLPYAAFERRKNK